MPASGASSDSFHNVRLMERSLNSRWMHGIFHFHAFGILQLSGIMDNPDGPVALSNCNFHVFCCNNFLFVLNFE